MSGTPTRRDRIVSDDGRFVFTLTIEEDGVVYARSVGYQDEGASQKVVDLMKATHQRLGDKFPMVLDITELDGIDPHGRKIVTDLAIGADSIIKRIAVFGGSFFMRNLIKLYTRVSSVPMGMFKTESEALEWLRREMADGA